MAPSCPPVPPCVSLLYKSIQHALRGQHIMSKATVILHGSVRRIVGHRIGRCPISKPLPDSIHHLTACPRGGYMCSPRSVHRVPSYCSFPHQRGRSEVPLRWLYFTALTTSSHNLAACPRALSKCSPRSVHHVVSYCYVLG